jgi:hypothetical protein
MAMIESLEITRYSRDGTSYTIESVAEPSWDVLEDALQTMDRFTKPLLCLCLYEGDGESDCMMINGGDGVYHLQIANSEFEWCSAVDPNGPIDIVKVWTSDQGFEAEAKFTWDLLSAQKIVRWYFDNGEPHPDFAWE